MAKDSNYVKEVLEVKVVKDGPHMVVDRLHYHTVPDWTEEIQAALATLAGRAQAGKVVYWTERPQCAR